MSPQDPTLPEMDAVEEELVAYLDEELEPEHRARVEQRLASDVGYRDKLRHLQQSWDMLDVLARSEPDEAFTRTTVAMIALKAKDAVAEQKQSTERFGFLFRAGVAAAVLACGLLAYSIGSWLLSASDRQLVADLPLIERVDAYRHAESVLFLELLDSHGLFQSDEENVVSSGARGTALPTAAESSQERRVRLRAMTPEQQAAVYEKQQRFLAMSPEDQTSLRDLYAQIESHPQGEHLKQVMVNYHDWLKVIPSKEQADVMRAPVAKRVAKIKDVQDLLAYERLKAVATDLSSEDIHKISLWLEMYVTNHEAEFSRNTPSRFKGSLDRLSIPARVSRHVRSILGWLDNPQLLPEPSEEELLMLHTNVSTKAQEVLDEADTPERKWQYAQELIRQVQISKFFPRISDSDMQKFVESLDPKQRNDLEPLTEVEMKKKLREMYYRQKVSPPGGMFPWEAGGYRQRRPDERKNEERKNDERQRDADKKSREPKTTDTKN